MGSRCFSLTLKLPGGIGVHLSQAARTLTGVFETFPVIVGLPRLAGD